MLFTPLLRFISFCTGPRWDELFSDQDGGERLPNPIEAGSRVVGDRRALEGERQSQGRRVEESLEGARGSRDKSITRKRQPKELAQRPEFPCGSRIPVAQLVRLFTPGAIRLLLHCGSQTRNTSHLPSERSTAFSVSKVYSAGPPMQLNTSHNKRIMKRRDLGPRAD